MIVITGVKGQLGIDILNACHNLKLDCFGIDRSDLDITDKEAVENFFKNNKFDILIHCAAYTAVDLAEDESALCYEVNTQATINLANACKEYNVKLVLISTDYVFDGTKEGFYEVDDLTSALSVYGKSKANAEKYIQNTLNEYFIIRISWVFGLNGKNFIRTMLNLAKTREEISVVSDQVGSPTYTKDVAKLIVAIAKTKKYGIYHATNEGECSWADLASYVFSTVGYRTAVKYIRSNEYKTKAPRPLNSRLSKSKLDEMGFNRLPSWQDAVNRYLIELKEEGLL